MPIIALSYILPTLAGIVSIGSWDEWATDGIGYGDVLGECLGYGWGVGFLVVAILSQMAIFNAYIASVLVHSSSSQMIIWHLNFWQRQVRRADYRSLNIIACDHGRYYDELHFYNADDRNSSPHADYICHIKPVTSGYSQEIPVEERDCWYIKGSKVKIYLYGCLPMIITVIALLVNGTEYFLLGFVSIGSAVLFYIAFKWLYGGLTKDN